MWTRSELKNRAKVAFRANYWHCVVVAIILSIVLGAGSSNGSNNNNNTNYVQNGSSYSSQTIEPENGSFSINIHSPLAVNGVRNVFSIYLPSFVNAIGGLVMAGTALFVVAAGVALSILLFNVLEVGCRRFFVMNAVNSQTKIQEIFSVFKDGYYSNYVVAQLIRNIVIFLWTLLLIIPGIIKSYEYRLVPYLLADYPDADRKAIFERSKYLMQGEKMNAFILDLSFFGWQILSTLTLGVLGIFYVNPYIHQTSAELYLALRDK